MVVITLTIAIEQYYAIPKFSNNGDNMNNKTFLKLSVLTALLAGSGFVSAANLTVGPGKMYAKPCAAFNAAKDGDTIKIEGSGSYNGDVCYISKNDLNIIGVNGRPKIDANGQYAAGKGIWVFGGTNNTIDNIELSGAKVPDQNGAAIRLDGKNLTVKNSYLHDNENGILTANSGGNVVVENSEFAHNGYGNGYSHNLYIGHIDSLTFIGNYSHDANAGHNLKTRATKNIVKYNRFSSSVAGTAGSGAPSYEVDFPNAGTVEFIGNIVQQPAKYNNPHLMTYGTEGATNGGNLYAINNTFINDASYASTHILVGSSVTTPVLIQNNIFAGSGQITNQGIATVKTNYANVAPAFVNKANYDLRPAANSPMVDGGSSVDMANLTPTLEYKHVAQTSARPVNGKIDIGAYESGDNNNGSVTWTHCANEGQVCSFTGSREVRYGANGKYITKTVSAPVACNNTTFGDPIVGVVKTCSYSTQSVPAPITWTYCANEGQVCSFTGNREVRYGANGKYVSKTVSAPVTCNNATFGDPIMGVVKTCSYSSASSDPTRATMKPSLLPSPMPTPINPFK